MLPTHYDRYQGSQRVTEIYIYTYIYIYICTLITSWVYCNVHRFNSNMTLIIMLQIIGRSLKSHWNLLQRPVMQYILCMADLTTKRDTAVKIPRMTNLYKIGWFFNVFSLLTTIAAKCREETEPLHVTANALWAKSGRLTVKTLLSDSTWLIWNQRILTMVLAVSDE